MSRVPPASICVAAAAQLETFDQIRLVEKQLDQFGKQLIPRKGGEPGDDRGFGRRPSANPEPELS